MPLPSVNFFSSFSSRHVFPPTLPHLPLHFLPNVPPLLPLMYLSLPLLSKKYGKSGVYWNASCKAWCTMFSPQLGIIPYRLMSGRWDSLAPSTLVFRGKKVPPSFFFLAVDIYPLFIKCWKDKLKIPPCWPIMCNKPNAFHDTGALGNLGEKEGNFRQGEISVESNEFSLKFVVSSLFLSFVVLLLLIHFFWGFSKFFLNLITSTF